MTPTPNTPSREAMDAIKQISGVEEFYPHADYALIIDRHFAPIRAELARLRNVPVAYCTTCNMEVREPTPTDDACTTALVNAQPNPPDIGRAISGRLMDLIDAPTGGAEGTPETDAIFDAYNSPPYTTGLIDVKHKMRDLERALTQSREEVARLTELLAAHGSIADHLALRQRVAELEGERDAIEEHHKITEGIIADAQNLQPTTGKALLHTLESLRATVATLQRDKARLTEGLTRIKDLTDSPDIDPTGDIQLGLHCWAGDRDLQDRYQGADFGYAQGVDRALEWAANEAHAALSAPKLEGTQPNIKT